MSQFLLICQAMFMLTSTIRIRPSFCDLLNIKQEKQSFETPIQNFMLLTYFVGLVNWVINWKNVIAKDLSEVSFLVS